MLDVLAGLAKYGVSYTLESNNRLARVLCPFHNDTNPSAVIDILTARYTCYACHTKSNYYQFIARVTNKNLDEIYYALGKINSKREPNIALSDVEKAHVDLFRNPILLNELEKRCVSIDTIKRYRLGSIAERIAIPVFNDSGDVVNIRLYLPGAAVRKFLNFKSSGKQTSRLYPLSQLAYDTVLLCGGEVKALAAAERLNANEIGCISVTGGEKSWNTAFNQSFADKIVYVCNDVDMAGKEGAEARCRMLKNFVKGIYKVELPLDLDMFPKGDINDYLKMGGDLYQLLTNTKPWKFEPVAEQSELDEPIDVDLTMAVSALNAKRRVQLRAVISSVDSSPYSIPSVVRVACSRKEDVCSFCPIYLNYKPEAQLVKISKEHSAVMELVGANKKEHTEVIREAIGIPKRCKSYSFDPMEFYNVEDARISSELNMDSRTDDRSMQIAYFVGAQRLELNGCYAMKGRMYPHPSNQQAALLISEYEPTEDALSTYKPTKQDMQGLDVFQPNHWILSSLEDKLQDIYDDIANNVTHIYKRQDMHLAADLAYHSPLYLEYDGSQVKGWVEVLILGDSGQGKSIMIDTLMRFYGLGEKIDCKSATEAGLKGGCQVYGKRWFIEWGKIPLNDRRLVVLEELKGASVEVIGKLTDMRSSGVAEIVKIVKRRSHARTRIIGISNNRSTLSLSEYNYGVNAVTELIGSLEDVRRFDLIYPVDRRDVDVLECQRKVDETPHVYTSILCKSLILFCWTVSKVEVEDTDMLLDLSIQLCTKYSDDIPIVDRGSMRFKLLRLAAALAGRTYSINGDALLVRRCHLEYTFNYIDRLYSSKSLGYLEYSNKIFESLSLLSEEAVTNKILTELAHPKSFVEQCLVSSTFDHNYLQDMLGIEMKDARVLLSFLLRQRALTRDGKTYRKTEAFTEFLKKLVDSIDIKIPTYLKGSKY
jgi:hypothetical protein